MMDDSLRERLVQSLEAAQIREEVLLALCDDSPPATEGVWTVKDNIAHLNVWRENATGILDAARLGTDYDGPANEGDVDAQNAEIYEAHRADSAATVRAAAPASYAALIEAIRACSEDDLLRERPDNAGPIWRVVPGNGHAHVAQHLSYWAADRGDEAASEEAARWGYTLDIELFSDNQPVADYNLACFYARKGNADQALPLLQAALRARPDLRRFALEDADIQPIREDPRVESLLGA
jgi:tetratricopeptide (TPR) repeat protein